MKLAITKSSSRSRALGVLLVAAAILLAACDNDINIGPIVNSRSEFFEAILHEVDYRGIHFHRGDINCVVCYCLCDIGASSGTDDAYAGMPDKMVWQCRSCVPVTVEVIYVFEMIYGRYTVGITYDEHLFGKRSVVCET